MITVKLDPNRRYFFQLVAADNGERSDSFACTPTEFLDLSEHIEPDNVDSQYVLILSSAEESEEIFSRFPLVHVSTFRNIITGAINNG